MAPTVEHETLYEAIAARIGDKLANMTPLMVIKFTVKQTLKQMCRDYEMEFKDLSDEYMDKEKSSGDYIDLTGPMPLALALPPTRIAGVAPKTGAVPTSMSRMKKEVCPVQ
jgi:hypothetical protein